MVADLLLRELPDVHPYGQSFDKIPNFKTNDKWNYIIHRSLPYGAIGRKRMFIDPNEWVKTIESSGRKCKSVVLSRDISVLQRSTTKRHTKKLERTKKDQKKGQEILSEFITHDEYDMFLFNYEAVHCLGKQAYIKRFMRWCGVEDWDGKPKIRNENSKYLT